MKSKLLLLMALFILAARLDAGPIGTVLILLFLPALYAAWFRIKPTADQVHHNSAEQPELRPALAAE